MRTRLQFKLILLFSFITILLGVSGSLAADCNLAARLAGEATKMAADNPSEAVKKLEMAQKLCPQSIATSYNLAMVYNQQGQYNKAVAQLEDVIRKSPKHGKALNALAYLIYDSDQTRALELAQRAVATDRHNKSFKDTLAKAQTPKYPAILNMVVALIDSNGNGVLQAGERGTLQVTIANTGMGVAQDIMINPEVSSPVPGLRLAAKQKTISSIPPGESRTVEFSILTEEENLPTDKMIISVKVTEKYGNEPDSKIIAMRTKAHDPPQLMVADLGIADTSENGQIEPQEIVEITARIHNAGLGEARGVKARVILGENVFKAGDTETEFNIGSLAANAYHDIVFSVYTSKRATDIPISVSIIEERAKFNKQEVLDLAFNRPEKNAPQEILVASSMAALALTPLALPGLSVDVDLPPKTGQHKPNAVAVVIGNKDYENPGIPGVEYANRDAAVMKQYLIDTMGFADHNIIFMQNAQTNDFLKVFGDNNDHRGDLYNLARKGKSDLFIFYSGHGAPDSNTGQVYLLPVGADPNSIKFTGYSLDLLYANLQKIGTEKKVKSLAMVFDACFSGVSSAGPIIKSASSIGMRPKMPILALPNSAIITSSSEDQISSWYKDKRHGLFTYFFLKGIKDTVEAGKPLTLASIKSNLEDVDSVNDFAYRLHKRNQNPTIVVDMGMVLVEGKK
ncbi:MAG: caspase family protein [Proteobacteria bacterium]|nr:caspase family protein [Pseudomonadota bacterium]MBU1716824.1 caspase family protein [Pseudomonadota bacterium]